MNCLQEPFPLAIIANSIESFKDIQMGYNTGLTSRSAFESHVLNPILNGLMCCFNKTQLSMGEKTINFIACYIQSATTKVMLCETDFIKQYLRIEGCSPPATWGAGNSFNNGEQLPEFCRASLHEMVRCALRVLPLFS